MNGRNDFARDILLAWVCSAREAHQNPTDEIVVWAFDMADSFTLEAARRPHPTLPKED